MLRRAAFSLVVIGLFIAACSKRQEPPQTPTPTTTDQPVRVTQPPPSPPTGNGRDPAAEETARVMVVLEEKIFFDYDRSDIRGDQQQTLTRKAAVLRANPNVVLRISGHADERGSVEYNLALGMRRAESVRQFLSGFGIDASRFSTETLGEDRPADPGMSEDAYARNRRAEFVVTRGGDALRMPAQ